MCYDADARPPIDAAPGQPGQLLTLTAADGNEFSAFLAEPTAPGPANILILPDVRGLHTFYQELALRFAETGVRALVLDYFGRTAGLAPRPADFEFMPHVLQMREPTIDADITAALARLTADSDLPTFTVGFCLGGMLSLIAGTHDYNLAGVIGFYAGLSRSFGSGTAVEQAANMRVPVLGLFGGDDPGIPAEQITALDEQLDVAGVPHTVVVYPEAPHSFFDRRASEFAAASADAWQRILGFVGAVPQPAA